MALGGCSQTLALHVQMELSLLKATVANYETTAKDTNSGGSSSFPSSHQFLFLPPVPPPVSPPEVGCQTRAETAKARGPPLA